MRNILLTAKYLADQDNANEIQIDHIKKALESLVFSDIEIKNEALIYLQIEDIKNIQHIDEDKLNFIGKKPKIKFSNNVKEFISFFKSKNITSSTIITTLFYKNARDKEKMM